MKYSTIIPAAGLSTRFKIIHKNAKNDNKVKIWCNRTRFQDNKLLSKINEKYIIWLSSYQFIEDHDCEQVIIVTTPEMYDTFIDIFKNIDKVIILKYESPSRGQTVQFGLNHCNKCNYVFIHDGCRPFLKSDLIETLKQEINNNVFDAIVPVIDVVDSVIQVSNDDQYNYLDRTTIKRVQTPQVFKMETLLNLFEQNKNKLSFNDELSLLKYYEPNKKIKLIDGDPDNIKITFKSDLK